MEQDAPVSEGADTSAWSAAVVMRVILAVLLCAAGACYVYIALGIRVPPLSDELGPRTFPLVVGSIFFIFSALYLVREFRELAATDRVAAVLELRSEARAWLTFGVIAIYCLLLSFLGYLAATFLFVLGLLSLLRYRGIVINALAAVLMTGAFYVVFGLWLSVPLPTIGW